MTRAQKIAAVLAARRALFPTVDMSDVHPVTGLTRAETWYQHAEAEVDEAARAAAAPKHGTGGRRSLYRRSR